MPTRVWRLLPFILNQRMVGIGLLTVALFHSFYFTARGGSPILGTFATIGLAIATSIGTVSIDAVLGVVNGLIVGGGRGHGISLYRACCVARFHWAAPAGGKPPAPPEKPAPDLAVARRSAWRSLVVVMPVIIWFLLSSASASYAAVMIKVSSMGQQAGLDQTRQAGKSLLASTVIGGIGAVIGWEVLSMWPSLTMYVLLIGLAGLVMGPKIFAGPGMHPKGATWSYGFLTMIVVLAPAVMDGQAGSSADAAFWSRLWMFIFATLYAVGAVFVFDTLWSPEKKPGLSGSCGAAPVGAAFLLRFQPALWEWRLAAKPTCPVGAASRRDGNLPCGSGILLRFQPALWEWRLAAKPTCPVGAASRRDSYTRNQFCFSAR